MQMSLLTEATADIWIWLAFAAVLAGFVDAVVGGGGMVLVPTLFTTLPTVLPATLLGTNKLAGVFGTATAVYEYTKKVKVPWVLVLIAAFFAFISSIFGAASVGFLPAKIFRQGLPFVLIGLLAYTLWNKNLGLYSIKRNINNKTLLLAAVLGATLGFYDGVFGPGTGSLLVFLWVKWFSLDFLSASACAKVVNFACNLGALSWFVPSGNVIFALSVWMAVFNIAGAFVGTRFALKKGDFFVRKIFIFIITLLIVRTSYDAFFRY